MSLPKQLFPQFTNLSVSPFPLSLNLTWVPSWNHIYPRINQIAFPFAQLSPYHRIMDRKSQQVRSQIWAEGGGWAPVNKSERAKSRLRPEYFHNRTCGKSNSRSILSFLKTTEMRKRPLSVIQETWAQHRIPGALQLFTNRKKILCAKRNFEVLFEAGRNGLIPTRR